MPHWLLSLRAANSQQAGSVPEVNLTATNSEHAIASVRDGAADLGFVEKPGSPAGLGSCVVGHDELVVVVPPSHKGGRATRWRDKKLPQSHQHSQKISQEMRLRRMAPGKRR